MSKFEKPADVITLIAPVGGAKTDEGYKIGGFFVIATGGGTLPGSDTVPQDSEFEGQRTGQVLLAKKTGEAWSAGDVIYWDDTAKESSNIAGDMAIGTALTDALSAATTASVVLNAISSPSALASGGRFVSTEQTGTGSPQNIPHGLGVVPSEVLIVPTDTAPATTGDYTAVEGAHDATNVIATVTTDKKYKVVAWR